MNLFTYSQAEEAKKTAPLAARMRPRTLNEFVGQEAILGEGKLLRRLILADRVTSVIFYGPPGTGKTTLAQVIAHTTQAAFQALNAVTAGVAELRQVVKEAQERRGAFGRKTVLFLDEIHRFNRAQQDALLPYVEDGTLTLIGATTENPFFAVNAALLSRSQIFQLQPLTAAELREIVMRALHDRERGLGEYQVELAPEALEHLVEQANGDARTVLNALELAVLSTPLNSDGKYYITLPIAEESIQKRKIVYDQKGDNHYDNISALIKSMRGSDPQAAVYWLAKMLVAGEDPKFIARRVVICAAEDIGNADPQALVIANAALQAVKEIGMPEARIPLAQAVIYLATAPKSNAVVVAIDQAMAAVQRDGGAAVPPHLRDAHYAGAQKLGNGIGYKYPHDYPGNYVVQEYLPPALADVQFYVPTVNGAEAVIKDRLQAWQQYRGKHTEK